MLDSRAGGRSRPAAFTRSGAPRAHLLAVLARHQGVLRNVLMNLLQLCLQHDLARAERVEHVQEMLALSMCRGTRNSLIVTSPSARFARRGGAHRGHRWRVLEGAAAPPAEFNRCWLLFCDLALHLQL